MKIKYLAFLFFLLIPIYSGCASLETNLGTIAGAVYYNDKETLAPSMWVRIYESIDPPVVVAELQGDQYARFFATLPSGEYYVLACATQDGTYSGPDKKWGVFKASTTPVFFYLNVAPPAG